MHRPIGLFDSGFGGLSVMREVIRLLPEEDLVYLGDTANLPYGNKSPQTITQLVLENTEFLLQKNIKLLIVACHTACSHALPLLQEMLPIPVIGVIEAGVSLIAQFKKVAILGTISTIESGIYQKLIQEENPQIQLFPQACPLFVPLVEEGLINHPATSLIAETYLAPLKTKIDAVLLACTHYPLLRAPLQKVLGPSIPLLEPAEQCALQVKAHLTASSLLNTKRQKGQHEFFATEAPEKFRHGGKMFLGTDIPKVGFINKMLKKNSNF